jgi:hypothetical protein
MLKPISCLQLRSLGLRKEVAVDLGAPEVETGHCQRNGT